MFYLRGPRVLLLILALGLGTVAPAVPSPLVAMASAAPSPHCQPHVAWAPEKRVNSAGNPYISAYGHVICNRTFTRLTFVTEIYMWSGSGWWRVADASYFNNNQSSVSARANSGVCAGTKQYFTQTRYAWVQGAASGWSDWKYSAVTWITC